MEFKIGDKVKIIKVGTDQLGGKTGKLVGVAQEFHNYKVWIVLFDFPIHSRGDTAITITQYCLEYV